MNIAGVRGETTVERGLLVVNNVFESRVGFR
jgi:hypothetical protein